MPIQNIQSTIVDDCTYLGIVVNGTEKLTLKVLDVYGKMAKTIQAQLEEGMNEMKVNISDLKVGSYVVNAFSGEKFLEAYRFVKGK